MNILLINFEYPPLGGGGGVATQDIACELAKRHTVHVLTTAFRGLPRKEVVQNVTIHRVPVLGRTSMPTATLLSLITFAPAACIAGIRIMKELRFDVLYAQFVIPSGLPAALLSKLLRVPFVLTLIGGDIYDPSKGISPHNHPLLKAIIRRIVAAADMCTAISQDTKKRAQELHGITQNIQVVPLGLKKKSVPPASRTELGLKNEDTICISIGRLVPRKGYDVLLSAWKNVPNAKLVIIGDGPLKEALSHRIIHEHLSDRVTLMGQVSEEKKNQLLSVSDMYVSAAEHEGFGIVFLEAMDASLPIVAANEGGQTDFLEPGTHALLVDPKKSDAIAQAVNTLIQRKDLRLQMGIQNKEKVREYYLETTTAVIENILIQAQKDYEHRN